MAESNLMTDDIRTKLAQLASNWDELKALAAQRGQKLDESLAYQQFVANVEEEEAWITEKQHLLSGEDMGDTLAAVQVCKHSLDASNSYH
jgi:spectrin alpha